jgi:ABC-2 type transport system permease protein
MVTHILKYRLKCFFRDRQMLFWTLIFPLLLATLFNMAFSNLATIDQFISIKVAVVDTAEYQGNKVFQSALASVSKSETAAGSGMFQVALTDRAQAEKQLEDNLIDGYIYLENGIKLVVRRSGLNQTIIKSFLDDYSQTYDAVAGIVQVNPAALQEGLLAVVENRQDYMQDIPASRTTTDPAVIYFYSLIAMTALYGGFWGMRVVSEAQADLSPQGARVSVAPVHKFKRLLVDIAAAFVIQFAIVMIVIAYIALVLKSEFGSQWGYVVLTAFVSCFVGVSYGACIAALVKKGEGIKTGVLIGSTMLMSFFSGMMYHGIKYIVTQAFPFMAWVNPANLMTDAFYALYYYDTYDRFFQNIAWLLAFGIVFCLLTYIVLRRQKYASI